MPYINRKYLATKAKDNHGHEHQVSLCQWEGGRVRSGEHGDWVLMIHDTGGSWYLDMLLREQKDAEQLAIDYGQSWYCTNLQPLLAEAVKILG